MRLSDVFVLSLLHSAWQSLNLIFVKRPCSFILKDQLLCDNICCVVFLSLLVTAHTS